MREWIGVDLDGTLAYYDTWDGTPAIGKPIPAMVERVKGWLAEGKEVRILTARMDDPPDDSIRIAIEDYCELHLGQRLEATCIKGKGMVEFWDDRAVRVEKNTGRRIK